MDEFKRYVAKQNSFYYNIFMVNVSKAENRMSGGRQQKFWLDGIHRKMNGFFII